MAGKFVRGMLNMDNSYVYYERLKTDAQEMGEPKYLALYEIVKGNSKKIGRLDRSLNPLSKLENISRFFKRAKEAELKKEKQLLNIKFGYNLSENDVYRPDGSFAKMLIEAFNEIFQLKIIFTKYLDMLMVNDDNLFYTCFNEVLEKNINLVIKRAKKSKQPIEVAIEEEYQKILPKITKESLILVFKKIMEVNGEENEMQILQQIIDKIRQAKFMNNKLIEKFIKFYNLDDIAAGIIKYSKALKDMKNGHTPKMPTCSVKHGGDAQEELSKIIINEIGQYFYHTKNVKVEGTRTGQTNQKADIITTVDIDIGLVEEWLEQNKFNNRDLNTKAIKKLQDTLQQFDSGFIVYVNLKDYNLDRFKPGGRFEGGFSAGKPISLGNFQQAAKNLSLDYTEFVRICMQLIPNAVGEENIEKVKLALCRCIGFALFDDFNEVGIKTKQNNSIHLLYLNGVYVPMSYYFYVLEKSFAHAKDSYQSDDLIQVDITLPDNILYPKSEQYYETEDPSYNRNEAWELQAQDALKNIKIQYHFLRKFQTMMEDMFF